MFAMLGRLSRVGAVSASVAVAIPNQEAIASQPQEADEAGNSEYSADAQIPAKWTPLPPEKYKLRMAVVVHRHGDRTPIAPSKGQNFQWEDARGFWEDRLLGGHTIEQMQKHHPWIRPLGADNTTGGRGQLTQKGASQLHNIGTTLRDRYVHQAGLLPRILNPADLAVRSTPVPRCYQSAAALLFGLYPKERRSRSGGKVSIYSRDATSETMWSGEMICPAQQSISQFWHTHFGTLHYHDGSEFKEVVDTVLHAFGSITDSPATTDLLHYGEILNCFFTHKSTVPNVELPDENFVKKFDKWRDMQFFHKYRHTNAAELGSGRLVREIASDFHAAVEHLDGVTPRKFVEYSCHDTSLIPLMFALGMMTDAAEWPKYSSVLVLELFGVDKPDGSTDFFVQALFNGQAVPMGQQAQVLMLWDDFCELTEKKGLSGFAWAKHCAVRPHE